ncbi:MAG: amino acid/amide transporter ATP-binding protein 2, family [Phycisphaerales bacterium]|nr:amino acid/amide transporter ATP-binding protein 2, family [Phycisphaerales bacterium]
MTRIGSDTSSPAVSAAAPALLSVRDLDVRYGAICALQGVSLNINPGEIVTLIGSNGAGKTTLLRTISGLLKPANGEITLLPTSPSPHPPTALSKLRPHEIVRLGISHVPEGRQIFPNLTVSENLLLGAYQRRDDLSADIARCHTLFPILKERQSQKAGTLSGGEQQMLAIARALMSRPRLLLLDEPSLGLAPLIVRKIFDIIREINAEGTTIFLVEQNAHLALKIAHRAYVLQTGRILMTDSAQALLANPEVQKAYLGG